MGRRTVLLIAALVVAALGTTMVFLYVNGVDDRAKAGQKLVEVLVAKNAIPVSQTGAEALSAGSFEKKTIAEDAKADGAIGDSAAVLNLVSLAPILKGAQIQQGMFGAPTATNQLPLKEGQFAMSISMADPNRVAGFLTPGSNVAVFVTYLPKIGAAGQTTQILLPSVQVIATGNTTVTKTTTTKDANGNAQTTQLPLALLTLAVDQTTFQKIVTAQAVQGALYFGLLGNGSKIDPNYRATNLDNLFAK